LKRALPQEGKNPLPQSKEDVMSSILNHLYQYEDIAIRMLVVLSFAFILFVILGGLLW